jgi:hypothetical protein
MKFKARNFIYLAIFIVAFYFIFQSVGVIQEGYGPYQSYRIDKSCSGANANADCLYMCVKTKRPGDEKTFKNGKCCNGKCSCGMKPVSC